MQKRRGKLIEINSALNKSTTKFGIEYRLLGACLFVSIAVFLFASKVLACLLLPSLLAAANLLTRKEPKMCRLWLLSFRQGSFYDPGSFRSTNLLVRRRCWSGPTDPQRFAAHA
jgi:type IV secretory pathway VirB3-like protein